MKESFIRKFMRNQFTSIDIEKLKELSSKIYRDNSICNRLQWTRRSDFVMSCFSYIIGVSNFWRFPKLIFDEGGSIALLIYFLAQILFAYPVIIMEMGIGQFNSRNCVSAFKMVPIFRGLGISQLLMSCVFLIHYSVLISWCLQYLIGTFSTVLPWSHCNHSYSSPNCIASFDTIRKTYYLSSAEEYYYKDLLGYQNINGTIRSIHQNIGLPKLNLSIDLLVVWILSFLILAFGIRKHTIILYFITIIPIIGFISLNIYMLTVPGTYHGLQHYLYFNSTKLYDIKVYKRIIQYVFLTLSPAYGVIISYASYNNFHDNFYRDATIIFVMNFFVTFLIGMLVFSLLGHLSWYTKIRFKDIVQQSHDLFFITVTDAMSRLEYGKLFTMLLMLLIIFIGLSTHVALVDNIMTSLYDAFIAVRRLKWFGMIFQISICIILFICGLVFVTPGGLNWFFAWESWVIFVATMLLYSLQSFVVGYFYGIFHFRFDLRMMMGFSINMIWLILMGVVNPLFCLILFIIYYITEKMTVNDALMPYFAKVICEMAVFIIFLPMVIDALRLMYKNMKNKTNESMITPETYGPYYKCHWLLDIMYVEKLLRNQIDQKFLARVSAEENFDEIIIIAKQIYSDFEISKTVNCYFIDNDLSKDSLETQDQ